MVVIVPAVRTLFKDTFGGNGQSYFDGIRLTWHHDIYRRLSALQNPRSAPCQNGYYQGALALGSRRMKEAVFFDRCYRLQNPVLWQELSLGIGRAIGETMAVIMVAGNQARMAQRAFFRVSVPLTANIVMEMGYATDITQRSVDCNGRCIIRLYFNY